MTVYIVSPVVATSSMCAGIRFDPSQRNGRRRSLPGNVVREPQPNGADEHTPVELSRAQEKLVLTIH